MKVRCVNELQTMQLRHLTVRNEFLVKMENSLAQAAASQNLVIGMSVACAAQGLHAIADGLIQNWLLDITAFDLIGSGQKVIDVYLTGLGFRLGTPGHLQETRGPAVNSFQ